MLEITRVEKPAQNLGSMTSRWRRWLLRLVILGSNVDFPGNAEAVYNYPIPGREGRFSERYHYLSLDAKIGKGSFGPFDGTQLQGERESGKWRWNFLLRVSDIARHELRAFDPERGVKD